MEKAHCEECRKDLWEHLQTVATGACDTEPVIREILSLRREKAHLCGYGTYPDYALRESMAGNGENAMKFVNELLDKVKAPFSVKWKRCADSRPVSRDRKTPV